MTGPQRPEIRFETPHGARIWSYWLGGKDNYPADREVGDAVSSAWPDIPDAAHAIIARALDAVPSGSYLALWDGTDTSERARTGAKAQAEAGPITSAASPRSSGGSTAWSWSSPASCRSPAGDRTR